MNKQITFRDQPVQYAVSGNGPTVMLLHGFGEDETVWNQLISPLMGYRLIIPVIPGSGTPAIDNAMLEDHAEWIAAILDQESIDQVILIGHSMGGYISLAFAEKYPGRVKALGLFHSSAYADDEEKKATRKKAIEFIKSHGSRPFLETSTPNLFRDPDAHQAIVNDLLVKGEKFAPETLVQYYEAMIARPDRTHVLREAEYPVLFILGQHDKAVPFHDGLKQTHIPANAYIHILRESGHMGMFEEPQKAVEILVKFIEDVKR